MSILPRHLPEVVGLAAAVRRIIATLPPRDGKNAACRRWVMPATCREVVGITLAATPKWRARVEWSHGDFLH
ncbi:hypothetical protein RRG08_006977 [Elysia crispata]|uniref:Uncharacterized protein n=1 Tax=Elysia crispata TaxID=231223 RepID=A0AAE0ZTZ3_9GAST|nr:hypothetical protein RRG08_006977 [Elysia crispata]